MKSRWFVYVFSLLASAGLLVSPVLAARGNQAAPKLLNLFLNWEIVDDDPAKLAKWDVVVLDMDQQARFPDKLREIKRLNPNIKLLAYVSAGEISSLRAQDLPSFPGRRLTESIPEAWYLHRASGERISWWPGNQILNASSLGQQVNGQRWQDFIGPFIRDQILSTGLWDGVFLDSAYAAITPFAGVDVDMNGDHVVDPARQNDEAYGRGMRTLVQGVRQAVGPRFLIMNNSSAAYASIANGALFENFPRDGWAWPFAEFRRSLGENPVPKLSALNTNTGNQERPNDYRLMRYGLTSALVGDGYFSFDAGDAGHHRTWWYDEYDVSLGVPRAAARVVRGPTRGAYPAVWVREYAAGTVLVNSTRQAETIVLNGEHERLAGGQDPATNNGEIVQRVSIPPEDGVVLLRRQEAVLVREAGYVNGSFLQMHGLDGARVQNGFFATREDVPSGATVVSVDLDRDGREDVVFAKAGEITVRFGNGRIARARPFGAGYRGNVSLAVGQTNRDAAWEVVAAPTENAQAWVVVLNTRGQVLRRWLAYRPEFRGGAFVALGDMDGDGLTEIATGPGRGGGPHIRFFRTDGTPWMGGFFAFSPAETAGARVAIGDVDGDGRAELVVGSGPAVTPRVQVYDRARYLRTQFAPVNVSLIGGVYPVLADLDRDGKKQLFIVTSAF